MTCPFLSGTQLKTCSATPGAYKPSVLQYDEYCMSSWYKVCPLFRLRRSQDGQRSERTDRPRQHHAGFALTARIARLSRKHL